MPDKIPKWIKKKDNCLFCNELSPLDTVYLDDSEKFVQAWYICTNKECRYLKSFNKASRMGTKYSEGYVKAWKKIFNIIYKEKEEKQEYPIEQLKEGI